MTGGGDVVLGWPFLVARGRQTDYRTVSAPDFLVQANAYGVLSDSVRRADMCDGDVRAVAIDSPVGELTATYTSERLEGPDPLSAAGGRWPTDEHGRPLQILYGVVTRHSPNGAVHARDLGDARRQAIAGFRRFLADEQRFTVDATPGLQLRGVTPRSSASSASVPLPPPPPDRRPSRRSMPLRIGAGAAAVVVVAAALWVLLHDPGVRPQPRPIVTVAIQPQPDPGSCTEPMVLTARITVDRATKLGYHWESPPGTRVASTRPLTFVAAGTRQVRLNADPPPPATAGQVDPPPPSPTGGRVTRIAYTLVIDAPAARRTRATYRLTC